MAGRLQGVFVLVLATAFYAAAELPDHEYGVYRIQQKAECPTMFCPSSCERYIDTNGCLFCGECKPKSLCPRVTCPNLPYFQCVTRAGRDGCATCKCRAKPKVACPTPVCSQECRVEADGNGNGCPRCVCPKRLDCPLPLREATPCQRSDCWRERGADGCYHCRCPDDVLACPDVQCDFDKKCTHVIDNNTGCAVGCQCNQNDI